MKCIFHHVWRVFPFKKNDGITTCFPLLPPAGQPSQIREMKVWSCELLRAISEARAPSVVNTRWSLRLALTRGDGSSSESLSDSWGNSYFLWKWFAFRIMTATEKLKPRFLFCWCLKIGAADIRASQCGSHWEVVRNSTDKKMCRCLLVRVSTFLAS